MNDLIFQIDDAIDQHSKDLAFKNSMESLFQNMIDD